jgi:hypothetical protein
MKTRYIILKCRNKKKRNQNDLFYFIFIVNDNMQSIKILSNENILQEDTESQNNQ